MSYEKCKEIALNLNDRLNACKEYAKAYQFYEKGNESDGDNGVIVLKSNGKAINFVTFILKYHPEKNPKEIEF